MTLEQEVTVIVMTTNIVENSKVKYSFLLKYSVSFIFKLSISLFLLFQEKCEKYWPDVEETLSFGEISVTTKSIVHYADFLVRTFAVKKASVFCLNLR